MLTLSLLNDSPGIRHAFFTREGGVSEGIYASLNCGPGSGDKADHVASNRAEAMALLGLPAARLHTLHQIHSATVVTVRSPEADPSRPKADGLVTSLPDVALGILTADCVPVLFADVKAGVIGAAHAGWKGALCGVLEATVSAMEALGAKASDIKAAIGPAIAQRSYEVGPEFPAPFLEHDRSAKDLFAPAARPGHHLFDLKGYVLRRLVGAGVGETETLPSDTYGEPQMFYSYRRSCHRGESDYGRLLSAISLDSSIVRD